MVLQAGSTGKGRPAAIPESAHYVAASELAFAVSVRQMKLDAAYLARNGKAQEEIDELLRGRGDVVDGGVSISVLSADHDAEYLRLDMFDDLPHYHYFSNWHDEANFVNYTVTIDTAAVGDPIGWAVATLRARCREMILASGGEEVAQRVDWDAVAGAMDEVDRLVVELRRPVSAG